MLSASGRHIGCLRQLPTVASGCLGHEVPAPEQHLSSSSSLRSFVAVAVPKVDLRRQRRLEAGRACFSAERLDSQLWPRSKAKQQEVKSRSKTGFLRDGDAGVQSGVWKVQCSVTERHASAQPALKVQELAGLRSVADQYKVWLLDQFGVLHDGRKAYPGAVEAVKLLAETGAQLVVISNSSKRASVTISKLGPLGFDPSWFVGAITSGELTHKYLKERSDPFFASLGQQCVHITWSSRQAVSTHGLGLTVVDTPEEADFILAHGSEAIGVAGPRAGGENDLDPPATPAPLIVMEDILKRAVQKRIPMIVANPDEVTVDGRDLAIMPGTLGKMYEQLGGHVQWMGKPDPVIYRAARDMLGVDLRSVVAVGDSLHHDIGGAAAAGIDSIFVAGGIHAADLGILAGGMPELSKLEVLLKEKKARTPKFCVPLFNW